MPVTGPKPQTWEQVLEKLQDNSYIDERTGCWIWMGYVAGEGYGMINCDCVRQYIHRLVYAKMICPDVPEVVRHKCDTPRCWNPEHLLGGTHQDNVDDKVSKNRHCFGVNFYNAKLTPEAVIDIRSSELSMPRLAEKYGVSRGTIHKVLEGKTWNSVVSTRSFDRLVEVDSEQIEW